MSDLAAIILSFGSATLGSMVSYAGARTIYAKQKRTEKAKEAMGFVRDISNDFENLINARKHRLANNEYYNVHRELLKHIRRFKTVLNSIKIKNNALKQKIHTIVEIEQVILSQINEKQYDDRQELISVQVLELLVKPHQMNNHEYAQKECQKFLDELINDLHDL